jgi:hypothetical protein
VPPQVCRRQALVSRETRSSTVPGRGYIAADTVAVTESGDGWRHRLRRGRLDGGKGRGFNACPAPAGRSVGRVRSVWARLQRSPPAPARLPPRVAAQLPPLRVVLRRQERGQSWQVGRSPNRQVSPWLLLRRPASRRWEQTPGRPPRKRGAPGWRAGWGLVPEV